MNFILFKQFNLNIYCHSVYRVKKDGSRMSWCQALATHVSILVSLIYFVQLLITRCLAIFVLTIDVYCYNITYSTLSLNTALSLKSRCLNNTIKTLHWVPLFWFHTLCLSYTEIKRRSGAHWKLKYWTYFQEVVMASKLLRNFASGWNP